MVGLAITEASYNKSPLKNAANKKINLKKCFLAKSNLPSNPSTELCKPFFRLDSCLVHDIFDTLKLLANVESLFSFDFQLNRNQT